MGLPAHWDDGHAQAIVEKLKHLDGATLPILHALQDAFGYVDAAAVPMIAQTLNLSRAEVQGTLSFYHDFKAKPAMDRVIRLCRAEACQAQGCESLVEHARRHGIAVDDHAAAAGASLETVYCLGNCALGPAAMVEGELVGRLDAVRLSALIEGASVEDVIAMAQEPVGEPA
ncbi:MAG: NADH-quinone oxidoreductase subunit E [Rhizobiales bacterium PAR1]|nr:MAG: NADH-quinone oxidoreductase subunit E [Rhizobiales bacterium PAR1]